MVRRFIHRDSYMLYVMIVMTLAFHASISCSEVIPDESNRVKQLACTGDKYIEHEGECYSICPGELYEEDNKCVQICAEKNGINGKKCEPIAISSVPYLFYSEPDQTIKIIFTVKVSKAKIKGFKIIGQSTFEIICYNDDDNVIDNVLYICETLSLSKLEMGNYKYYWVHQNEDISDTVGFNVEVNSDFKKLLLVKSIENNIIKIPSITDDKPAEIILTYIYDNEKDKYEISLLNFSQSTRIDLIRDKDFFTPTSTPTKIVLKIRKNLITEELYSIITKYKQKTNITFDYLYFIIENIELKNNKSQELILKNTFKNEIVVEFNRKVIIGFIKDVSYSIGSIKYPTIASTSLKPEGNNLIILEPISFINDVIFRILNAVKNEDIYYSFIVYEYPSAGSFDVPIYYYSSETSSIQINYNADVKVFYSEIFGLIQIEIPNKKSIEFTLDKNTDNQYNILKLKDASTPESTGKFEKITFYQQDKTTIAFESSSIIIIDANSIPHTFKENTVNISRNKKGFTFSFNEALFPEYFQEDNEIIKLKDSTCTLTYDNTPVLQVTCPNTLTEEKSIFIIQVYDSEYSINVHLCKSYSFANDNNECKLCNELNPSLPYYHNEINEEQCIETCPKVFHNYICKETCNEFGQEYLEHEKECIIDCPPDLGYQNNKCVPKEISSMTNVYAITEAQTLTITFNSDIAERDRLKFYIRIGSDSQQIDKCEATIGDAKSYTCITDAFKETKEGSYKIYWSNVTGLLSSKSYEIYIIDKAKEVITIGLIAPKEAQIPSGETGTDIIITYLAEFDFSETTLKLYDINKQTSITIEQKYITSVEGKPDEVKLTLTKEFSSEGIFTIQGINANHSVMSLLTLMIYKEKEITIKKPNNEIDSNIEKKTIEIEFNSSIFKERIQKVMYKSSNEGNAEQEIISYSTNNNLLSISKTIKFSFENGKANTHIFTITDKFATASMSYTITVKDVQLDLLYPTSAKLSEHVLYYNTTRPYFDIEFVSDLTNINIFGLIQTNEKNVQFKLAPNEDSKSKCKLMLSNPSSLTNWGYYTSIKFFGSGKDSDKLIFEIKEVIIVNVLTIPHTLIQSEVYYHQKSPPTSTGSISFPLSFKEDIYEEYFTAENEKITIDKCSLAYLNKHITITCSEGLTESTQLNIKSFDKEISFNIILSQCFPDEILSEGKCQKCKDTEFFYKKQCLSECPSGTITNNKQCLDSCDLYFPIATLRYLESSSRSGEFIRYKDTCIKINQCSGGKYHYEAGKKCYDICPKKYNGVTLYSDDIAHECLGNCKDGFISDLDNKCVKYNPSKVCLNADKEIKCIEKCPIGTVFDENKNDCVYNGINLGKEEKCEGNECGVNGTCEVNGNKKKCVCRSEYYGVTCEIDKNEMPVTKHIENEINSIFLMDSDYEYDVKNGITISQVLGLTQIIADNENEMEDFNPDLITKLIKSIIKTIEESIQMPQEFQNELVPFISLGLKSSILRIKQIRRNNLRLLETSNELLQLRQSTQELVNATLKKYATATINDPSFKKESAQLIKDEQASFSIFIWTNDPASLTNAKTIADQNTLSMINITDFMTTQSITSYSIVKAELSSEYTASFSDTQMESITPTTNFKFSDLTSRKTIDRTEYGNGYLILNYPIYDSSLIKAKEYKEYMEKDIDIYQPEDKVFTDPCYFNKNLQWDFSQKFKYQQLFSEKTIQGTDPQCSYEGYDIISHTITLKCPLNVAPEKVSYHLVDSQLTIDPDKVNNLPTMCASSINSIQNNFAFWTYLLVLLPSIILMVVFGILSLLDNFKYQIPKLLINDKFITESQQDPKQELPVKIETIPIEAINQSDSLGSIILDDLYRMHPISTLFYQSILTSTVFKIFLFMYNVLNCFGFNALFYDDTMIDDKMTDEYRDNFGYPMKSEFEKIICTILTSIGLTIIVRAIVLVTAGAKEEFAEKVNKATTIEAKHQMWMEFSKKGLIRRIIAYVFMAALTIFFFYYTIVFCGIYINTQYGWFYSGLWTLFMNWVIFAPVSILIVAVCDKYAPSCGYYAKQLFWF